MLQGMELNIASPIDLMQLHAVKYSASTLLQVQ